MWSPEHIGIVTLIFLLSGLVKGVIGFGLPSVSLALLTATFGLKDAMAIMLIPTLCTNVLQSLMGGHLTFLLKKFGSLIIAAAVGTWLAAGLLAKSDAALLSGLLGLSLASYAGFSLFTPQIKPPGVHEKWLSPLIGAISGLITGLTGSFIMPGVLYLQAIGLPKNVLIQAMGIIFTAATLSLAISLGGHGLLPIRVLLISTIAIIPAFIGMGIGRLVTKRLPENQFRKIFFIGLLLLSCYIIAKALTHTDFVHFFVILNNNSQNGYI